MAPRIDPALPLVWRTPTDLQLGAATPRVVLRDAGDLETGLIAALRHGASIETLTTIGAGLDGTPDRVRRLLAAIEPAFDPSYAASPGPSGAVVRREVHRVAVDAPGSIGVRLAADLAALGHDVVDLRSRADEASLERLPEADRVDLAVVGADWVVPPARHLPWLRRDVPHLAVVFDDVGARVGPLVEPGDGPCLRCLDLARRDHDPAWPVIAAQLAGRPASTRTVRGWIEAAALAIAVVDDRLRHGSMALRDASLTLRRERPGGLPRRRRHESHPECGCRAPGGTATAPVPLDARRRSGTSSATAGAVPS